MKLALMIRVVLKPSPGLHTPKGGVFGLAIAFDITGGLKVWSSLIGMHPSIIKG
jgi:hypothetical protein